MAAEDECHEIRVYYDFASTICFGAHRLMQRMQSELEDLGIALRWTPLDLTRMTRWERGAEFDDAARANALRVAEDVGVPASMPGCWLDSRDAHATAIALGDGVKEIVWRERIWTAVFEESRDIGDPEELVRLGRDVGVEPTLGDEGRRQELIRITDAAWGDGVTGVPTFMVDEWPFGGIQTEETMRHFFRRFLRKRARERARSAS